MGLRMTQALFTILVVVGLFGCSSTTEVRGSGTDGGASSGTGQTNTDCSATTKALCERACACTSSSKYCLIVRRGGQRIDEPTSLDDCIRAYSSQCVVSTLTDYRTCSNDIRESRCDLAINGDNGVVLPASCNGLLAD